MRILWIAAMPACASAGLSAVNWMSLSVAKFQSLPPVGSVPSGEISLSACSAGTAGWSTGLGMSAETDPMIMVPALWLATVVSIPWNVSKEIGNGVEAGIAKSMSCQPTLIGVEYRPV